MVSFKAVLGGFKSHTVFITVLGECLYVLSGDREMSAAPFLPRLWPRQHANRCHHKPPGGLGGWCPRTVLDEAGLGGAHGQEWVRRMPVASLLQTLEPLLLFSAKFENRGKAVFLGYFLGWVYAVANTWPHFSYACISKNAGLICNLVPDVQAGVAGYGVSTGGSCPLHPHRPLVFHGDSPIWGGRARSLHRTHLLVPCSTVHKVPILKE